jgi:hypothetical protein
MPLLVLLAPLRVVGVRLRELLLHPRSCFCVFASGMLAGDGFAARGHETDDDQGYDDQRDDDPRDHARQPTLVARL